ncbi:MAG: hypothetical protein GOU98_01405 [Candidatus Altiarchaeota archaeon]|nr:hypothetical protein [Candidatus Altiarchaeota archaeon]
MWPFTKKCKYCNNAIKGDYVKENVKVPGYLGTRPANFCSESHAESYKSEVSEHLKNQKQGGGGGCC